MTIRTKHFGVQIGHNDRLNLPAGIVIGLGRNVAGYYRVILTAAWDWRGNVHFGVT